MEGSQRRRRAFKLLGVDVLITPRIWQTPVVWVVFGSIVAQVFLRARPMPERLLWGVGYGVLALLSFVFVHLIGHIIGGRRVNAVMSAAVVDGVRVTNLYEDDPPAEEIPPRVHLSRALGGPTANLTVSAVSFVLWGVFGAHALLFLAILNLLAGLSVLLPSPGVDGEVIWRELRRLREND